MNHLKVWLAIFVAGICSFTTAWAERTAPTFPEDGIVSPKSGGTYYIYNEGTGLFMGATSSSNWDPILCTLGKPFLLTESTDGTFTIRYAENGYSITAWSTGIGAGTGSGAYFNLTATEGGYLISRKDATDQYLGCTDGSTSIVPNLTEGNIVWQFLTEEAGARYCAELRLYNALVAMDTYAGLPLEEYEEAYADRASLSAEELDAKAASLEKVYTLYATYTFPSWADVPILLEPTQGYMGNT